MLKQGWPSHEDSCLWWPNWDRRACCSPLLPPTWLPQTHLLCHRQGTAVERDWVQWRVFLKRQNVLGHPGTSDCNLSFRSGKYGVYFTSWSPMFWESCLLFTIKNALLWAVPVDVHCYLILSGYWIRLPFAMARSPWRKSLWIPSDQQFRNCPFCLLWLQRETSEAAKTGGFLCSYWYHIAVHFLGEVESAFACFLMLSVWKQNAVFRFLDSCLC